MTEFAKRSIGYKIVVHGPQDDSAEYKVLKNEDEDGHYQDGDYRPNNMPSERFEMVDKAHLFIIAVSFLEKWKCHTKVGAKLRAGAERGEENLG
jgi:hypothetical protein